MDKVFSWILVRLVDGNSILYVSWAKIIETDWNTIKINDFEKNSISKMLKFPTKHITLNIPFIWVLRTVHFSTPVNKKRNCSRMPLRNVPFPTLFTALSIRLAAYLRDDPQNGPNCCGRDKSYDLICKQTSKWSN